MASATPAGAWREQAPGTRGRPAEMSSRDGLEGSMGKRGKGQDRRGFLGDVSVWAGQDQ